MYRTSTRAPGLIVAVLALAGVVAAGMQTLIVPLIGQLPTILGTSADNASWVVTATLLASAVAVPVAGRLGDLHGRRRVLLISVVPLIAGSAVCALSGSLVPMLLGRGLQGLGMGVVPLGIALLREVVPPGRVASSVALMSASMGIGGAFGLPFAAAVAQTASWQAMFWTFAALATLTLVAVWRVVPAAPRTSTAERFDALGAVLLSAGLVGLLLAVSKGATWGWTSPATLGCATGAVVVLGLWVAAQLRSPHPLVNLRSISGRPVAVTTVASLLVSFGMYAQSLVIPQVLQLPTATGYGLGQSMLAMALWLAPGGFVMMAVAPLGARLSRTRGPKVTLAVGATAIAVAYAASLLLIGSTWGLMVAVMLVNVGTGLAYGAIPLLIMSGVPRSETAAATGFNTLVRSLGTSSAAAVVGVLLATGGTLTDGHLVPSEGAFRLALVVGCAAGVLAAVVAATIPAAAGRPEATDPTDPTGGSALVRRVRPRARALLYPGRAPGPPRRPDGLDPCAGAPRRRHRPDTPEAPMVRVMLVDDQEMIRLGLRTIIDAHPDLSVVAESPDGLHALRVLEAAEPPADVVLMDIRMPGVDGVETTRRIRRLHPPEELRIIVLTTFDQDRNVLAALRAGADGFLGKGVGPAELTAGILDVAAGGGVLSAAAAAALIGHVATDAAAPPDEAALRLLAALTAREREVVEAVVRGLDNQQIAEQLVVSPFTVKTHVNRAMTKVGARDRAQLVSLAVRAGIRP